MNAPINRVLLMDDTGSAVSVLAENGHRRIRVLQISPWEPPSSGWTRRIGLLKRTIEERGGTCVILDIGPNRTVDRSGCVPVYGALDFLRKIWLFTSQGYIVHAHVNAEWLRGLLLGLAASLIARIRRNRCLVTFHGGSHQQYLMGWRRYLVGPLF